MKKSSIVKSTIIVMFMALITKFIGFGRDLLIAYKFGATDYTDAYKIAASIPDTIFVIVGLAISTAFLPLLSRIKVKKDTDEMHKFANNVINILLIISLVIFLISSFMPEKIVAILTDGAKTSPETIRIATNLTRITLVNLLFLVINACFIALLQVHEDFIIPSILGLFFNLPIILYLLIFKDFNVYGLTVANVIGNSFKVLAQIPSLRKNGYRYRFFINIKDEEVHKIVIIILPVIVGAGANSINMIVDKKIASGLGSGVVTVLDNAQLLITFINTAVTTSISNVIYPLLANRINEGKHEEFIQILSKTIIYLAIFLIPISIGTAIYSEKVVRIAYFKYSEEAKVLGGTALLGYSLGILFTGIRDVLNSTLFSMGKTKIAALNGVIGVIVNIILSVILSKKIGIMGVSLASSIAMIVTSILLLKSVTKLQGKLEIKSMSLKALKILISSAIMALVVIFIYYKCINLNNILQLIIGGSVAAVIYFLCIYLLRLSEAREVIETVRKKIKV
ncbi:putative peptidoglycan lipid II flippase [Clostridium sp. DSM 8431]|uniref:murein biosynthesis integral membrane protein MurJ n=1 Tax=Clostridium sp. DSM 8431 TaxID=1761781 RepID=UPI0008E3B7BD|nr:murein biosynthesis integral membrane protein MurJ [Clostridium sp. DSM 8431]SFU28308.1 putative peptidoglycan lipid II flippase [Clostridium sp. DSM 8431]